MNKQELIEKIEARNVCDLAVSDSFKNGFNTMKGIAVDLASELDEPVEPELVEVPQFVADWYEVNKDDLEYSIWNYIFEWKAKEDDEDIDFKFWMGTVDNKPLETLIRMQDGYTVKQEPKYRVKVATGNYVYAVVLQNTERFSLSSAKDNYIVFTDKSKAEAVATLVDGTVEEV